MGDAATPALPDFTSQTASVYKANIDAGFAVADRLAWAFAPHEQDVGSPQPDMTVRLEAGAIWNGITLTEVAEQDTPVITAPTTDPRIDRVVIDATTGTVSVITGTEAASPTAPAITAGKLPIAQVSLTTSTTIIADADITDERSLQLLGLGDFARKNASIEIKTANYTIQPSDDGKVIGLDGSLGDVTATLPATADVHAAFSVRLKRIDDGSSSPIPTVKVVPDPGSPTEVIDGQQDFEFDDKNDAIDLTPGASKWHITASHASGGGLQSVQVFTSSGTWTKPAGINKVLVYTVGGGGGGGGVNSTDNAAGGGGGGGMSIKLIDVSAISSETVTVGSGGAGGVGQNDGAAGGTSSFGAHHTALGGAKGLQSGAGVLGGLGGGSSGGDVNLAGSGGGTREGSSPPRMSGFGGSSPFGGGGRQVVGAVNGGAGGNYGGGGAGAVDNTSTNRTGGAGAGGIVMVWEYS